MARQIGRDSMKSAFLTFALLAAQCNTPAPSPVTAPIPSPDAGHEDASATVTVSAEQAACENLARVGCPEGQDPLCAKVLAHGEQLTKVPVGCLSAAKSPAAVQACGFVRCQQ